MVSRVVKTDNSGWFKIGIEPFDLITVQPVLLTTGPVADHHSSIYELVENRL